MSAQIQIICGDGKGKTTSAVGCALAAAAQGRRVVFVQFFKSGTSSEIKLLKELPAVEVLTIEKSYGFFKNMDEQTRARARQDYSNLLKTAISRAAEADLLVLDEAVSAYNHAVVPQSALIEFLKHKPDELCVVLTGRNPPQELADTADSITEIVKRKHPYDKGVKARRGIEF